jgi:flagellum-specific peptidoglycan hydrolase FlgJ
MAATRAKARALRDFTNIGITCLEELGDLNDVIGNENSKPKTRRKTTKKKEATPSNTDKSKSDQKSAATEKKSENQKLKSDSVKSEAQPKMSKAQRTAIINLSARRGIAEEELGSMAEDAYGASLESLTSKDAAQFIRSLQQQAA